MSEQTTPWKRSFFTIVLGQTASLIGSSAVQFSLIWWMASETSSPMILAFSGLMAFLPQLLLGPFAGVWVDRLKRKTVIIAADLFMGIVAVIFALSFITGTPPYWAACIVLGIRAIGGVFHTPASQAIVPLLVPQEELVRANGWSQFMQSGAFMLGPVFGALMYTWLPLPIILITDLIGAIIACLTVAVVKIPELSKVHQESPDFIGEMKAGAAVLFRDKKLAVVTVAATLVLVFYMPLSSYYPLMASSYFKESAFHGSLIELAFAGGMMLCSLMMGIFGTIKCKFLVVHIGLMGIGLTSLLAGILPPTGWAFWIFAIACTGMGASGNLYGIPLMAYMQETIPPEAQGRVFSLFGSLMSISMPIGLLISGPVAERYGVVMWFFISGIAICIITCLSGFWIRGLRRSQ